MPHMLGDGPLTFREFVVGEPLPLARIHDAVLEFLQGRDDAVLFGAQAVNAYVAESRLTQDVDILSPRAEALSEEVRAFLADRFHVALRVRAVASGRGFRIFQPRKEGSRNLVVVRTVPSLPASQRRQGVLVLAPANLIAMKVLAYVRRKSRPKSGTDWADLARLLLAFPDLKASRGPVRERLVAEGADATTLSAWEDLVAQPILPEDEEGEFS